MSSHDFTLHIIYIPSTPCVAPPCLPELLVNKIFLCFLLFCVNHLDKVCGPDEIENVGRSTTLSDGDGGCGLKLSHPCVREPIALNRLAFNCCLGLTLRHYSLLLGRGAGGILDVLRICPSINLPDGLHASFKIRRTADPAFATEQRKVPENGESVSLRLYLPPVGSAIVMRSLGCV